MTLLKMTACRAIVAGFFQSIIAEMVREGRMLKAYKPEGCQGRLFQDAQEVYKMEVWLY